MKTVITAAATVLFGLIVASTARAQTCVGDCDHSGTVEINELVLGVNIALEQQPLSVCPSFACQGGGTVPVNCLVQGVNNALNGCSGTPGTPTVTPTPTPGTGGVMRTFSVYTGDLFAVPGVSTCTNSTMCIQNSDCPDQMCPASSVGLFTSALTNLNATTKFSTGPFKLLLGPGNANGVHQLTLTEDAVFAIEIVNSTCLCLKFKAQGSTGSVDCHGGTPYDTSTTQADGPVTSWTFQTGLGTPAGPGNGNLVVTGFFQQVSDVCSTVDCSVDSVYMDPPNTFPFTTTNATSFKGTSMPVTLTDRGAPFDCANFGTSGSGGILACGVAQTNSIVGPTANVLRFAEKP